MVGGAQHRHATLYELEKLNSKLNVMRKSGEFDWLNPTDDREMFP